MKEALDEAPPVEPSLAWVWKAYMDLASTRVVTMGGPQPIAFDTIDAYARRFGPHATDEFERFFRLINALDITHRDLIFEEREAEHQRRKYSDTDRSRRSRRA